MELDIRLLGSLEVEADGRALPLGGPRSSRLLAVLLLNANITVPKDRLIDIIWEDSPTSARQQIHNVIGSLRHHLGSVPGLEIVTGPLGYRVELDDTLIDLVRFRTAVARAGEASAAGQAERATALLVAGCALWRGPALAGLDRPFFQTTAARLEEERLAAVESLARLRVRAGERAAAVVELTELVAQHPLRESLRVGLMEALYLTGRTADALAVYDQGRRLLAEELGLDPGADLKALHEAILRGTALPEPGSGASAAPAAAPAPPRAAPAPNPPAEPAAAPPGDPGSGRRYYLPHDPRDFQGREPELARLAAESRQDGATSLVISAINGMGGVGKTALAVRFAHTVEADYPDGQYFVDLQGHTIGVEPLSPSDALSLLLRQRGVPDELIPSDLDGRVLLWRREMAGQRAVVVLDNAVDAQQVRPLVPGSSGPLVLITSRRRLPTLEGASSVPLDVMPIEDGVALFRRIVGPDRLPVGEAEAELHQIIELCGRLPLAVRIAAARFRDRASWTLAHLERLLGNREQRFRLLDPSERGVFTALTLSYRYLTAEQSALFRLLSLHPGPSFDTAVASAVSGLDPERTEEALESMFDDNLIQLGEVGRYSLHDLVRDCSARLSREHDDERTRQDAFDRLVDLHLQRVGVWSEPLARGPFRFVPEIEHRTRDEPAPQSPAHAFELLSGDSVNLLSVAQAALTGGCPRRAWQLVCALQPLLRRMSYPDPAPALFDGALEAAREAGDRHGEMLSHIGSAFVRRERLQMAEALQHLETAAAISGELRDRRTAMYVFTELGTVLHGSERFLDAYRSYATAAPMAVELEDHELSAAISNNLGLVCVVLGRAEEGREHLTRALAAYREYGRGLSEAHALANLGMLGISESRFDEALAHLEQAVAISRAGGYTALEVFARMGLCECHSARGELKSALDEGRAALGTARDHGVLNIEPDALNALGEAHSAARDNAMAASSFENAARLAHTHGRRISEARAFEGLAHLALRAGDGKSAHDHFRRAVELYPPDVAAASGPRVHLADPSNPTVSCRRCVPTSRSGGPGR